MSKIKTVFIVGPTASGKTDLAVKLANEIGGEIVCADSMQIYKGIEIASACPTPSEKAAAKHHLCEFLSLSSSYSVSQYVEDAKRVIADIDSRGLVPIVVGGTGLYIDSLAKGIEFNYKNDMSVRERLKNRFETENIDDLYSELKIIDPVSAQKISPNDTKRIFRALEIYFTTGKTKKQIDDESTKSANIIDPLFIGLSFIDREKLYDRINLRVDKMIENGLIDEVKRVYKNTSKSGAAQAIGHKELVPYILGQDSLENCVEKLKMQTRRYAKRQLTWFRKNQSINWLYLDENQNPVSAAVSLCRNFLKGRTDEN